LRATVAALIAAVRQVGRSGDEDQRASTRAVLDQATRTIYSILAQGPSAPPSAEPVADSEPGPADETGVIADAGFEA
jgi:hypothetical protein